MTNPFVPTSPLAAIYAQRESGHLDSHCRSSVHLQWVLGRWRNAEQQNRVRNRNKRKCNLRCIRAQYVHRNKAECGNHNNYRFASHVVVVFFLFIDFVFHFIRFITLHYRVDLGLVFRLDRRLDLFCHDTETTMIRSKKLLKTSSFGTVIPNMTASKCKWVAHRFTWFTMCCQHWNICIRWA